MTHENLLKMLNTKALAAGSWKNLAEQLKVSPQYLHDCKKGARQPGKKLLDALGLAAVTEYKRQERVS